MPSLQCLIADDSEVIRRVAHRMIGSMGMAVAEATNGQEVIEHCGRDMPDVLLLDWLMPIYSGLECLQALRRMPGGDKPRVIYCTTENDPVEFARAVEAGADGVIVKPFDRQMLEQKLFSAGPL
jgi:two-component system chemotaxis response regulator CheY